MTYAIRRTIACFPVLLPLIVGHGVADESQPGAEDCYRSPDCYSAAVGSGQIDTSRLSNYHARWNVRSAVDGAWQNSGATFEEMLAADENGNFVHTQTHRPGDGTADIGTRILDGRTLQVLSETLVNENRPADQPVRLHYDLRGTEYAAEVTFASGDVRTGRSFDLPIPMYDGQIAGLAIAALPLAVGYTATLPVVIAHSGSSYAVHATVVGRSTVAAADDRDHDVWEVGTRWVDLASGAVSEAGKDEAGGAYYIATDPAAGVPHVIEYANSSVRIVWDGERLRPEPE